MELLLIAIPLLVVLGLVGLVASARRRDVSGAGTLSRETRARDKDLEDPLWQKGDVKVPRTSL